VLYVKLRRTDKTTKALRIASSMGVPLLVADNNRAMIIERMSKELKLPVNVLRANNMRPDSYRGRERCPIVIDDVDAVLRNLFGVEVLLATSTGEEAQLDFDEISKPQTIPNLKTIGITRQIDSLGRVVLPKELRDTMDLPEGTPIEFYTEGETIILKKYQPGCVFCGDINSVEQFKGQNICPACRKCILDSLPPQVQIRKTLKKDLSIIMPALDQDF